MSVYSAAFTLVVLLCYVSRSLAASESIFNRSSAWKQYVRASPSTIIKPSAILATTGNVHNANALLTSNPKDVATLTRSKTSSTIPTITLDLGQNTVGYISIVFANATKNNPGIRVAFSETQQYLSYSQSDFTRSNNGDTITPGTDQYVILSSASFPLTWMNKHGCLHQDQVCSDGLHGHRYLTISLDALSSDAPYSQPNGSIAIASISLSLRAYHGTPGTFSSWFLCSDPAITQYWYDAAYTNELVLGKFLSDEVDPRNSDSSSLDGKQVLFDGAKRDRDPYVGDIAVSGRTTYLSHSNGNQSAANVLADLANHQRADGWIPPASIFQYTLELFDYPLWWVTSSWDYILYTGDMQYANQFYKNLIQVLDSWYPSVTGSRMLLQKGLAGTDGYGDYAFVPRTGEVTYYNALYVLALENAASWAKSINKSKDASRWSSRATNVSAAINTYLWDSKIGAYLDSTTQSNSLHAQDGNSLAILAYAANFSRAQSSLKYMSTHMAQQYGNAFYDGALPGQSDASSRVYAFISYFELQARFVTYEDTSAMEEIRRLYGWFSAHDPNITMWEGIGIGGTPYQQGFTSMAHGWSTGILPLLSNFVLGVNPSAPGYSLWYVEPHVSGLNWAQGEVGTPHGIIYVSWRSSQVQFAMNVTVPLNTSAEVAFPWDGHKQVILDGKNWTKLAIHTPNYGRIVAVAPGDHQLTVQ